MALVQPNSISTKILPGLSLDSTKTQNKGYRPTTTIMMCKYYSAKVACKRRSSANSGVWLRRFVDTTRVEKSCVAKSKEKKLKKNVVSLQLNMRLPQT